MMIGAMGDFFNGLMDVALTMGKPNRASYHTFTSPVNVRRFSFSPATGFTVSYPKASAPSLVANATGQASANLAVNPHHATHRLYFVDTAFKRNLAACHVKFFPWQQR